MILRGHLPRYTGGRINADAKKLLSWLLPKGEPVNKYSLSKACKHLHLAFKGYEPAEVYNVLAAVLLKVINRYDPGYTDKVKKVVAVIQGKLRLRPQFAVAQVNAHVEFESKYIVRMLARKGYLEQVGTGKQSLYRRVAEAWPPPPEFFDLGRISLPFFVAQQFRCHFKQHIVDQMAQIDAN